jgi:hypothetical protein
MMMLCNNASKTDAMTDVFVRTFSPDLSKDFQSFFFLFQFFLQ